MKLKIKKLHPAAITPKYATEGSACFDLHAVLEDESHLNHGLTVYPNTSETIRVGLAFEVPKGFVMLIFSRSGHGFKNGVRLSNAVGVLDSDYRGECMVKLHNDSRAKFKVSHGDRIAQAMLLPVPTVELEEADDLSDTARGTGGFGSTGTV
jgi:dUTP pyrophosphatase